MTSKSRRGGLVSWMLVALICGAGVHAPLLASTSAPVDSAGRSSAPVATLRSSADDARTRVQQTPQQEGRPVDAEEVDTAATGVGTGDAPLELDTMAPPASSSADEAVRQARTQVDTPWYSRLVSVLGLFIMIFLAWLLSVDRRSVPWRVIGWGLALQFIFALFILKTSVGEVLFGAINTLIISLLGFTVEGASFLFGNLVWNNVPVGAGEAASNAPLVSETAAVAQTGAFFAFNVLPTIIFFSSLMSVLYYLGFMQALVRGAAWVMVRTMRTSGAETLSTAGNIFVGQTEAPLLIKPFVERMTRSELMAVMTGGFATVAGGVMAGYVGMLVGFFPDIAGHLLAASVMSAPAALLIAKVMYPEDGEPATRGKLRVEVDSSDANVIDAAARGAGEGLTLALNVGAMLLAFVALIAMLNALLGFVGDVTQLTTVLRSWGWIAPDQGFTLQAVLGWVLAPLAWVMGVPWGEATQVGALLGIKTALNEFVAYLELTTLLAEGADLSPRSIVIATYALAGFANFGSIAIQIGGIGGIAPSRRSDLSKLGLRAMIGGSLAAFMTATVAGILV